MVNRSMKMKLLRTSLLAGVVGSMWLGAAAAQEAVVTVEEDEVELLNTQPNDEDASVQDKVVVVGSLIKRDEYSSISPVQIINADIQRDKGLVDATSIFVVSVQAVRLFSSMAADWHRPALKVLHPHRISA